MIDILFNKSSFFRKVFTFMIFKLEGGSWKSPTIRKLYKKYREIDVGYGSYGGWMTELFEGPATIGNYTSIGRNLRRMPYNHHTDFVTTHPIAFNPSFGVVKKDDREKVHLTIGNDVWIGDFVMILPSCTSIGNGAVIGAGAVVTKDIPPYEIWGGVPARYIRNRFSDDVIKKLEKSEWWDLPVERLKDYLNDFPYPEVFADRIMMDKDKKMEDMGFDSRE